MLAETNKYYTMATMALQAEQNGLIRMILDVKDISVLERLRSVLVQMGERAEEPAMSKDEILSHIDQSCKEANLIREGRLEAVSVEELMNEL